MQIDIDMDHVTIDGQRVNRPSSMGRTAWMGFWEKARNLPIGNREWWLTR